MEEKFDFSEEEALKKSTVNRKVIIFFFLVFVGLIAFLFFQKNQMEKEMELKIQFIEEKNMLRDELDDLIDEHDGLLEEYGNLNEKLHDKDSIIQKQITEIRNLLRVKNDLNEARKKILALKEISKKYLANIDSLIVLNKQLFILKDSVIKENKNINWKNYKLNKQNKKLAEKIHKGSVLELFNLDVETIKMRSSGKELVTKKAKKVQKIKVCFTIGSNHISTAETKRLYMQLIDPGGDLILGDENINVLVNDSIFKTTTFIDFEYQNIKTTNCFEWERVQQLHSGYYLMNLIIEGRIAAQKRFELK
tara:strand:- start:7502 stop:8422 length:921 start_codon:yes stop_codon:yes gene_type:complete